MQSVEVSENKTLQVEIIEALDEAVMLEMGRDKFDESNMLTVAMGLSGAPFSFVERTYMKGRYADLA